MNKYMYSVMRFVPDAASGEFVNIGAIAGSDEQAEWDARAVSNQKRASSIDAAGVLDKVMGRVSAIQSQIANAQSAFEEGTELDEDATEARISEAWLDSLYRLHQRLLQFSEPAPILAESASDALDRVFQQLVIDPAIRRREFRTRSAAYSKLLAAYKHAGLRGTKTLRQRQTVQGAHHKAKFDFAIANGRAVQLANAWSFETPNLEELSTEVKAWAWAVQDLRRAGGSIPAANGTLEVPSDVDIEVLYLPPTNKKGESVLAEAIAAFEDSNVRAIARPESAATEIAEVAADRLKRSLLLHP